LHLTGKINILYMINNFLINNILSLWDNLHDHEVEDIINLEISQEHSNNNEAVNSMAKKLANSASIHSQSK